MGQDNAHEGLKTKFHREPSPALELPPMPGNASTMKGGRQVALVDHSRLCLLLLEGYSGISG
jgi:hypothetical protein